MAGEDGPVSFDVYGGVYTVTGVDERREEQAKRVMVPDQQSVVLDQLERPVGGLQDNYHAVSQNGDTVEGTQDALARDLIERLHAESVSTVFVSALTDVLNAHWSVGRTPRQHNFWTFRAFVKRLVCTAEEYGITVEMRSEAWTSQECPQCGSIDRTTRHRDTLTCPCGFEGHADLTASETFLKRQTNVSRPMARPVCLKWDDHQWSESPYCHRPNEEHTNAQVAFVGR